MNYYDKNLFTIKEETYYNNGRIKYLYIADVPQKIPCPFCKKIMTPFKYGDARYCDIEESENGSRWTFLFIEYSHIYKYQCRKCQKKFSNEMKIPCKRGFSQELENRLLKLILVESIRKNQKRMSWSKLIDQFTIHNCEFRTSRKSKDKEPKDERLITHSRINQILTNFLNQFDRIIDSYKFVDTLIFYPFIQWKDVQGIVLGSTDIIKSNELLFYGICKPYSDLSFSKFLTKYNQKGHSEDILQVEGILASPSLLPLSKSVETAITAAPNVQIMLEGIEFELGQIQLRYVSHRAKNNWEDLAEIRDIEEKITTLVKYTRTSNKQVRNRFRQDMNRIFSDIPKPLRDYYTDIQKSFENYPIEWLNTVSIKSNKEIKKIIEKFDRFISKIGAAYINPRYLFAIALMGLVDTYPPIQKYTQSLGSLTKPITQPIRFACGTATSVVSHSVPDEFFVSSFIWEQTPHALIVGYEEKSYCQYNILKYQSITGFFDSLSTWEKAEVKRIYCDFDPDLVYSLMPMFPNATISIDLEKLARDFDPEIAYVDDSCSVLSAAINIYDEDYDSIQARYPAWVWRYRPWLDGFEGRQVIQAILDMGAYLPEELDLLFKLYSKVAKAPELLQHVYFASNLIKNYPELHVLLDLTSETSEVEELTKLAEKDGIRPYIDTPKEFGHKVLMRYRDVAIDFEELIDFIVHPNPMQ